MLALFETGLQVLLLLLSLLRGKDFVVLASVSVTRTSTMTSVPWAQKPWMRRSPRSSLLERDKRWTGDLGSLALVSSAVRPSGMDHWFDANC